MAESAGACEHYGEQLEGREETCDTSVFEIVTVTAQIAFDDLRSYATLGIIERAGRGLKSSLGGLLGDDNKDPKKAQPAKPIVLSEHPKPKQTCKGALTRSRSLDRQAQAPWAPR